jgi:hypothetical protein
MFAQPTELQPLNPYFVARKRTSDAEVGWRPAPEKNIKTMP